MRDCKHCIKQDINIRELFIPGGLSYFVSVTLSTLEEGAPVCFDQQGLHGEESEDQIDCHAIFTSYQMLSV